MNRWAILAVVAVASAGCPPGRPNLLHQRGGHVWIMDGAGKNAKIIAPGTLPRWICADGVELFVGTPQAQIEAVQWHTGQKRVVGPGFNPCNGGDCH